MAQRSSTPCSGIGRTSSNAFLSAHHCLIKRLVLAFLSSVCGPRTRPLAFAPRLVELKTLLGFLETFLRSSSYQSFATFLDKYAQKKDPTYVGPFLYRS